MYLHLLYKKKELFYININIFVKKSVLLRNKSLYLILVLHGHLVTIIFIYKYIIYLI